MKALRFVTMSLGLLATPVVAYGQACMGAPVGGGQYGIEGGMGMGEGFKSYTGGVNANLNGPLAFNGGVSVTKPDAGGDNITTFGANGGYELTQSSRLSACPTVGVSYSSFSTDFLGTTVDINQIVVPVGVGLGTTLPAGRMNVTLFAVPQFLWFRTSGDVGGETQSDTQNEFGLNTGLRLGMSSVYAGAGMSMNSIEDSDPVFNFGVGLVLGGRR
ncbi:MAG TPA: hypothetical protein VK912_09195 [Longimicrobiales bacterium]|nr:hypothetical protein [Longimicrobiales bacterium]